MKHCLCLFILLLSTFSQVAGITLKGTVRNADDGQPLEAATVFLSGSSYGCQTDQNGQFQLKAPISGFCELTATYIGYQMATQRLKCDTGVIQLNIGLKPRSLELNKVQIYGKDPNREKNLKTFRFALIGNSKNAEKCRIVNPSVIRLERRPIPGKIKEYTLYASADSAIIIENESLGYTIRYQLEYLLQNNTEAAYKGSAYFIDNLPRIRNKERILSRRSKAYEGSRMHFFRSLAHNRLREEGFEVIAVKQVANTNYDLNRMKIDPTSTIRMDYGLLEDTVFCTEKGTHLRQTNTPINLWERIIPNYGDGSYNLFLNRPFEIRYTLSGEDENYSKSLIYHEGISRKTGVQTTLARLTANTLRFYPNGSMEEPNCLLIMGYWSYLKIADLLPWEYKPE